MTIVLVNGPFRGSTNGGTLSITVTAPTSGNVEILAIGTCHSAYSNVTTISQTNAIWTMQKQQHITDSSAFYANGEIWLGVISGGAGGTTITVVLSAAPTNYAVANVCEWSGLGSITPLDVSATAGAASNATNLLTGTTGTTNQAAELAVGLTMGQGTGKTQATGQQSYTLLDGTNTGGLTVTYLYKILSSTGTTFSGATISSASYWLGLIATFKGSLFSLSGVTRDSGGNVLTSCTVLIYNTTTHAYVASTTSDGVTGAYSFSGLDNSSTYFCVAFKAGSPDVMGVTDNNLTGV